MNAATENLSTDWRKSARHTALGIGPGGWNARALATSQELRAQRMAPAVLYRIYTEHVLTLETTVRERAHNATIVPTIGVYNGTVERGAIVEIVGTDADLQTVRALASAIILQGAQECALLTVQSARGFVSEMLRPEVRA